ncbi:branched-chain amino acid transport system II carrier protein [Peptoniphilus sp. KCTC 25270]|uniref:branched-chain amino acid transport system II carrier protein n=1 Tax=Peptoniphilus sp. KCTC 25270 TaxID=2897414 RepID=UPI001E30786C|nr:branched-chain amino acid transport system II carrier protein [Peptoniphilus sp. KCTC 25270]MCD1147944.1 branched-chain amino acid transport system II carrier protein [Peptoniphilus sp. KCTC 25270]
MQTINRKDIIICGFALFAIFFGAGNLIFPPYLGVLAGDRWFTAMVGFLVSDPVLPILGVIVTATLGGRADDLGKRVSPAFSKLVGVIAILTIGPFFAVPRTGATTHEIFVQQLFPAVPSWVTSIVFFGLTLYLALNPGKVIDYIGKFLTPALLVILTFVVVVAIVNPPGAAIPTTTENLFAMSFKEGYQTMDALGAPLMAGIVATDLIRRGYKDRDIQLKASIQTGIVAFILLAFVYGGLTYAGATVSASFTPDTDRTVLLIGMVEMLLGSVGKVAMAVGVALACLTTSVGLTSTCGNFFDGITNGKISYKLVVFVATGIAFALSLIGVEGLIAIAVPILSAIYPVIIALIFFSIFDKKIKYNMTYTGAVVGAFAIGIVQAINLFSAMRGGAALQSWADWTYSLPLGNLGFEWVIPSVVCAIIFTVISMVTGIGKTINDPVE